MECLHDYIGIRGCGHEASASGLYIDQLPGIGIESIDKLGDGEADTFIEVWQEVQLRALRKFTVAVKAEFNKCHRITDNNVIECLICSNRDTLATALWYYLGCELMIERTSSHRVNRYTTIDLDKAEHLKAEFYAEAQSLLKDAVSSIDLCNSECVEDECLEPNSVIRFIEQTP